MGLVARTSTRAPWRPFYSFERVRSLLDELSDGLERDMPSQVFWSPAVELGETDGEQTGTVGVPGKEQKDVEIEAGK